jgi:hypothetical protein
MTARIYGFLSGGVGAGYFHQLARPEEGKRPTRPNVWQFHVTFAGEQVTCYTTDRALARELSRVRIPDRTRCLRMHGRFCDPTGRNPGFYVDAAEHVGPTARRDTKGLRVTSLLEAA